MFSKPLLFKSYSDHPADAHLRIVLHTNFKGEYCTQVENTAEGCKGFGHGHYFGVDDANHSENFVAAVEDYNRRGLPTDFTAREVRRMKDTQEEMDRLHDIIRQQTFALESLAIAALPREAKEELAKYAALGAPYKKGE